MLLGHAVQFRIRDHTRVTRELLVNRYTALGLPNRRVHSVVTYLSQTAVIRVISMDR